MTADNVVLVALIVAAGCGLGALIALPFVFRAGNRQIDRATSAILQMRDEERARQNLRIIRAHELEATLQRARRRQEGGAQ